MILVLSALAQEPPPIAGGTPASEYPQAVLLRLGNEDWSLVGTCTGTLIAPEWVLTAGHCLRERYDWLDRVSAWTGSEWPGDGEELEADDWFAHPSFQFSADGREIANDLGLVHLAGPSTLAPITLNRDAMGVSGETLRWVGWGSSSESLDDAGTVRRSGDMTIVDFDGEFILSFDEGGVSACPGDSGGPALRISGATPVLMGVTSFGFDHEGAWCDGSGDVTGSSRVDPFIDWIEENTGPLPGQEPVDDEPDYVPDRCACGSPGPPVGLAAVIGLILVRRRRS